MLGKGIFSRGNIICKSIRIFKVNVWKKFIVECGINMGVCICMWVYITMEKWEWGL